MTIEFHPAALGELREARLWYLARSPVAAASFAHEVDRAIRRISQGPERYPKGDHGTRSLILRRFPFSVVYRSTGEHVTIVAIAHQKRRPGYWSTRRNL